MNRPEHSRGFTVMEVMVSVMILSVSVVSIFGAQFAAVATTEYSRNLSHALNLARCRMSEIELEVLEENGFQIADVQESGECCEVIENETPDNFSCEWEIKRIELPDITEMLNQGGADGGLDLLTDLNLDGPVDDGENDFGIISALGSFMPLISDMLGEGIRRVTVRVKWQQGAREKEFILSQFIVHPSQDSQDLFNAAMLMGEATGLEEDLQEAVGGSGSAGADIGTALRGGAK